MSDKKFIGSVKVDFKVPTVPNFVRLENGSSMAIQYFTDDGLKEIGRLWTERLIQRAQQQRDTPDQPPNRGSSFGRHESRYE